MGQRTGPVWLGVWETPNVPGVSQEIGHWETESPNGLGRVGVEIQERFQEAPGGCEQKDGKGGHF